MVEPGLLPRTGVTWIAAERHRGPAPVSIDLRATLSQMAQMAQSDASAEFEEPTRSATSPLRSGLLG
jgi:hypothetical protein